MRLGDRFSVTRLRRESLCVASSGLFSVGFGMGKVKESRGNYRLGNWRRVVILRHLLWRHLRLHTRGSHVRCSGDRRGQRRAGSGRLWGVGPVGRDLRPARLEGRRDGSSLAGAIAEVLRRVSQMAVERLVVWVEATTTTTALLIAASAGAGTGHALIAHIAMNRLRRFLSDMALSGQNRVCRRNRSLSHVAL